MSVTPGCNVDENTGKKRAGSAILYRCSKAYDHWFNGRDGPNRRGTCYRWVRLVTQIYPEPGASERSFAEAPDAFRVRNGRPWIGSPKTQKIERMILPALANAARATAFHLGNHRA